ncbi:MAG: hypothetical protein BAJATHORv1_60035 [Candidatus Thorarchaeota archaeon]|nr:MAG: hypothetical protein BAJATHORv1_60035 [Candidatus Thorarchaeota archaeon]
MAQKQEMSLVWQNNDTPKTLFRLKTRAQEESLKHPLRQKILRVLCEGILDFEIEREVRKKTLQDGTSVTHHVTRSTPTRRFWMTVSEIHEAAHVRFPEFKATKQQCYYHLNQLIEHGLIKEHQLGDARYRSKKPRARFYRSIARFFISQYLGVSPSDVEEVLETLKHGWDVVPKPKDRRRLKEIFIEQERLLSATVQQLAEHLVGDSEYLLNHPNLIEQVALVFLSDDDDFVRSYQETKEILIRSSEGFQDIDANMTSSESGGTD